MDSSRGKMRMNVEDDDRLSSLPDALIHKILSFISIKHAIQTSVLSSRWRFIWTSMPYLNFSRNDFSSLLKFSEFVTHVLSDRNNQTEVSSVKLSVHGEHSDVFVKQIINYAFSHNVQTLNVASLFDNDVEIPLLLFSSQSLKHLSLTMDFPTDYMYGTADTFSFVFKATSTWELPALTSLYLRDVTLCCDENNDKYIDIFSKFVNLKNLSIIGCETNGFKVLNICLPLLSNLELDQPVNGSVKFINVVAPQLKNLTITDFGYKQYLISATNLVFLRYKGYHCFLHFPADDYLSLEKADICLKYPKCAHQVLRLLQQLRNVKFLTLSLEIVELLSLSMELISNQPSPFANLKSLKVHPERYLYEVRKLERVKMSSEVRGYLLDSSPGATFTMVSREEYDTKLAQNLIKQLRTFLEKEKAGTETKMTKMHEQGKAHVDVDMSWKKLNVQIEKGREKASFIISMLKDLNGVLTTLSASNRATIQPSFSTLLAETDIVMKKITACIKMDCDENQRHLSLCFHELATNLQSSS